MWTPALSDGPRPYGNSYLKNRQDRGGAIMRVTVPPIAAITGVAGSIQVCPDR